MRVRVLAFLLGMLFSISALALECVAYVRQQNGWTNFPPTGGEGEAYRWWDTARNNGYVTVGIPKVGSVLVWKKSDSLSVGHVAIVTSDPVQVDAITKIKVRHANWPIGSLGHEDVAVKTNSGNEWTSVKIGANGNSNAIYGFIYPRGAEIELPHNGDVAWIPESSGNVNCDVGVKFFRIGNNGSSLTETSRTEACGNIETSCAMPPPQSEVEEIENPAKRTFWQKLWNAITSATHFLFGANPVQACESTVSYGTFVLPGSPSSASFLSSGNKIGLPVGLAPVGIAPQPDSGPKPDITPDYDVFDDPNRTHEISANCDNCPGKAVVAGRTIYHRLEAEVHNRDVETSDLRSSKSQSIDGKVECRVSGHTDWAEIPGSENELEYDVDNLVTDENTSVETVAYTVPDYPGSILECRGTVDDDDEVDEENEGNNRSRTERFLIRSFAGCNIVVENVGLVNGATVLNLGEAYGFEMMVASIGMTGCENDMRSSYSVKGPNASSFSQVADDGTEADDYLCPGCRGHEYTLNTPFTATTAGVYAVRACADYQGVNPETDEGDNCLESVFEVIDPNAIPDPDPNSYEQADPAALQLLFD